MDSVISFQDFNVDSTIISSLKDNGFTAPFAIQQQVLPDTLAGHDVLVQSPTGSGKTLAFAIPIANCLCKYDAADTADDAGPRALVLVPTRELASQVVEEFSRVIADTSLKVTAVYGGLDLNRQAREAAQANVIVATPGRLNDLVSRRLLNLRDVEILVLDEADRMLDMGFQPQVDRIVASLPTDRQTMFFSATLEGKVGRVASRYTREARRHEHEGTDSENRLSPTVLHNFVVAERANRTNLLLNVINQTPGGLILVFCRTKRGADELVIELEREGLLAGALHGDLNQNQRERTLQRFEQGKIRMLVATDVAARGLDLNDISHVVNYDAPEETPQYVHRVGRTGRAGREGLATTFVQEDQRRVMSDVVRTLGITDEWTRDGFVVLAPRMAYASRGFGARRPMFRR